MKVTIQGSGRVVSLGTKEFRASGGEGSVYVTGGKAYKIYKDASRMIPAGKVKELSLITLPEIVKPEAVLLDAGGHPVGYTMREVPKSFPIVQLFGNDFRKSHGMTPERCFKLIQQIQGGIKHVHGHSILLVDINEMNFLLSARDLTKSFFIDVDSYQTAHYPATAIMDSARDWLAGNHFTEMTDWFSFGLLAFNIWIGIHPYRGTHPTIRGQNSLRRRAEQRISALNSQVSLPGACLPFSVIPPAYFAWFEALFERGERLAPPEGAVETIHVVVPIKKAVPLAPGQLRFVLLRDVVGYVRTLVPGFTLTSEHLYAGSIDVPVSPFEVAVVTPKQQRTILANLSPSELSVSGMHPFRAYEVTPGGSQLRVETDLEADDMMVVNGERIILKVDSRFLEVRTFEPPARNLPVRMLGVPVGNAMPNATTFYRGLAVQVMLGAAHISLFPEPGSCVTLPIPALDGYRVIDARCERNIVQLVGEKQGKYTRFILKFDAKFGPPEVTTVDVTSTGPVDLNFIVLDTGVCVQINEEEELVVFSARMGSSSTPRVLKDPGVDGTLRLFSDGARLLAERGGKIYHLSLTSQ